MTIREANKRLLFQLYNLYEKGEAESIADLIMESLTGRAKVDRITNNTIKLTVAKENLLDKYINKLMHNTPVQYVLHEAWFSGIKLYVDENVLIPRPETEELVEWVVSENKNRDLKILDIGTGSGCIAIALKKKLPLSKIFACDVSDVALEIVGSDRRTRERSP